MLEFLLAVDMSRADGVELDAGAGCAHRAAGELFGEGTPVRLLRATFAPEDKAAERAVLPFGRIAEAVAPS